MKTKIPLSKLVGIVSTAALITASIAPNILRVPVLMRPWVFLFTLAWTLLAISGIFTS